MLYVHLQTTYASFFVLLSVSIGIAGLSRLTTIHRGIRRMCGVDPYAGQFFCIYTPHPHACFYHPSLVFHIIH
ncbi:hypothetical protein LZ30DRAFT_710545 [Colletotrichum cereale]|nr:hypothetical protein LZ30DRAFT_710545 [Colletotrichum cereale]